jgi:3-oxoadipate enol-lactonase / 4-carboxymuconolactone decarboxylase
VRLHARSDGSGDAPPLLLLDSLGSTTEMWTPIVGVLAEQFRVVRIDHRGHGGSAPSPVGTPSSVADLAEDVLTTMDELGLGRVDAAGVSLGGMVGMWLAIHRPERIGRLALLCTSAHLTPLEQWHNRADAVRAHGMSAISDAVVARWITPSLAGRDPELVARLGAMVSSIDAESYAQCCEAIATMDLRPDLGRIAAPTVVVAGANDVAIPRDQLEAIASAMANARLEVLEDAAHVPTFERPGAVAAILIEHFRAGATLAAGFAARREVLGDTHVDRAIAATTPLTAPFQDFITRYAWGDIWTRGELTRREQSMVTLSSLVTLGAEHELAMHVRAALRNGLRDDEIVAVLMHTAVYAGVPRANRAIAIARDVLDDE